jgi:hypothetical protein
MCQNKLKIYKIKIEKDDDNCMPMNKCLTIETVLNF